MQKIQLFYREFLWFWWILLWSRGLWRICTLAFWSILRIWAVVSSGDLLNELCICGTYDELYGPHQRSSRPGSARWKGSPPSGGSWTLCLGGTALRHVDAEGDWSSGSCSNLREKPWLNLGDTSGVNLDFKCWAEIISYRSEIAKHHGWQLSCWVIIQLRTGPVLHLEALRAISDGHFNWLVVWRNIFYFPIYWE